MSIGTRQLADFMPLAEAITRLSSTIVVAACSNQNEITAPACFPNVIGVRHIENKKLQGTLAYVRNPYDGIETMTYVANGSNSHAAPMISAYVCDYLSQGVNGLEAIKQKLRESALYVDDFADYEFYRNLFLNWENANIPIVAILGETSKNTYIIESLLSNFNNEGYRAVCLSRYISNSTRKLIFNLSWTRAEYLSIKELIGLYYNFTLPDILFYCMDLQDLVTLPQNFQADIIIKSSDAPKEVYDYWNKKYVLNLYENTDSLFCMIKELLGE